MKSILLFLTAFFTSKFKERRDLALENLEIIHWCPPYQWPAQDWLPLSKSMPFSHTADIAWPERVDRIESMGRFEVAATDQETELIGGCTQACGDLLDRHRKVEVAFALHTFEYRR